MIVLGLNFGHDAGACVVKDGKILSVVQRERIQRVKHSVTLDYATVEQALKTAGINIEDIDYCAASSTQHVEMVTQEPDRLSIAYEQHEGHTAPSPLYDVAKSHGVSPLATESPLLKTFFHTDDPERHFLFHYSPELKLTTESELGWAPHIDQFSTCELWSNDDVQGMDWIRKFPADKMLKMPAMRDGFHYPLTLTLEGKVIPGYYIYHHMAHAASAYYPININRAAILCHDGGKDNGTEYNAGMVFLGEDNKLIPILPPHLRLGRLYEGVAQTFSFGMSGGPGKLMGLTSYGRPRFFDHRFVGNHIDWIGQCKNPFVAHWLKHCTGLAEIMSYDISSYKNSEQITSPINADIASSTQHLFEEILLATSNAVYDMFVSADIEVIDLCYAGGVALNCPANSRLLNEGRFDVVHIPPWCDDGGLAIGAALCVYHNIFDHPLPDSRSSDYDAYLGRETSVQEAEMVLQKYSYTLIWEYPEDPAESAAEMIADNKVIGWMEGRSEIGPRALGHRSIFANVTIGDNWKRVNQIKSREQWRPFAPMVLEEDNNEWFQGGPSQSPHMLFTAHVKSDKLPAITHVDGTARVQTVRAEDGDFQKILGHLKRLTGVPVMMNTSFNGPGEPIVDIPEHAVNFFLKSNLDAIFINGIKVVRTQKGDRDK